MTFRKLIGKLHLWLGLSSGLVVFIVALTGCIYAFQDEIKTLTRPYLFVEEQQEEKLPPSVLKEIAEEELPGKHVHAVMYNPAGHSVQVIFYSDVDDYYYFVYINPYTGHVLKVKDEFKDFFRVVLNGHYYLWLPDEIGHTVVASATLIFLVLVVSGIILWWPRNKNGRKQRFSIKWTARWRRKNYDLHNVLGFYVSWMAIIFAITGLVWGFEWFSKAYYTTITGGEKWVEYAEPTSTSKVKVVDTMPAMDRVWYMLQYDVPVDGAIEVHTPETETSSIAVNINPDPGTYWKADYRYFDQYSLKELGVNHMWGRFEDAKGGRKLMRMNYDIHVGAILGLPGKILAFFGSLIIASMPVTGFLIWWGRRNKKR